MSEETWKYMFDSKRCEYYISDLGRVKSVFKVSRVETLLNPVWKTRKDSRDGKQYKNYVVRFGDSTVQLDALVAKYFVDNSCGSRFVTNLDGNPENCRADNLKWGVGVTRDEQKAIFSNVAESAWDQHPEFEKNLIDYILTDDPVFLSKAWIAATPGLKAVIKGQIVKYRGFVPCMSQVHDALQETFCMLIDQIKKGNVRNPEKLWGYVVRIARSTTVNVGKANQHFSIERDNFNSESYSLYDLEKHNNQDYAYTPAWGL